MSVTPERKSLKHLVKSTFSPNLKSQVVIDNSVIEGNFTFNNCKDVHIGPKYENKNSIVINNISVPNVGELPQEIKLSINKEGISKPLHSSVHLTEKLYDTYFTKPGSNVITKATFTFALLIVITLIGSLLLVFKSNERSKEQTRYTGTTIEGPDWKENYPTELRFVLREAWGAAQPHVELNNNTLPLKRVIFIHTAGAGTCNKFYACKEQMQSIQDMHITQELGDIGYNFVIGSDGYVYVGVGWDKVGAHTQTYNYGSLGVAFIGDFRRDEPNDLMLTATKTLLEFGIKRKKLDSGYQVFGHCQIHSAFPVSPGKHIMNEIKKWSHWNDTNVNRCVG